MSTSTLFSTVYSLLQANNSRTSQDQVSTAPVVANSASQTVTSTAPIITTNTIALPKLQVPIAVQQQLIGLVASEFSKVLTAKAPSLTRTIDIGTSLFRSSTISSLFTNTQPQTVRLLTTAGMSVAAANNATNVINSSISASLPVLAAQSASTLGSTTLTATQYSSYVASATNSVSTTVGDLVGVTPTDQFSQQTGESLLYDITTTQPTSEDSTIVTPTEDNASSTAATQVVSTEPISPITLSESRKVYLKSAITFNQGDVVEFKSQPRIEVEERAEYDVTNPIHAPTGFASYKSTILREVSVTDIKLFSRTTEEATKNIQDLQMLKSWLRPYFGESTPVVGAPPDILFFYAYSGDSSGQSVNTSPNFYRFPVVLTSLSYNYPNDVDYIPTIDGTPFPVIMVISIRLMETRSPTEVESFSIHDYKQGNMLSW